MMRLLVTGGTGFIGAASVRAAHAHADVHILARRPVPSVPGIHHSCDMLDPAAVARVVETVQPTHLLHLAWIATPGVYWSARENLDWVEASKSLLLAFARCGGKRAVITGSCAEYDWSRAGVCSEEVTPLSPLSTYGQCKVDLARWAEEFGRQRRISIAWARAFFLYGPGEHAERLVPSVARALFAGKVAEVSSGAQRRDFLHVDDLADALVALTGSPLTGAVNIGSGEAVEVRTVIDNIARICGRPELVRYGARSTPPGDPPLLVADVGRLRHELNWQPRIGLADGLKDTVSRLRLSRAA